MLKIILASQSKVRKKILDEHNILNEVKPSNIDEDVVKKVRPILNDPDFTYSAMKTKSGAAANLCNWVVNIIGYNEIYKRVKPLMDSCRVS